ncbi:MAG: DUF2135 domain-containing protein [Planctomycetes bacterium]|nr:DUF2135 domain-containing protein [Planctomycetota bacterium]
MAGKISVVAFVTALYLTGLFLISAPHALDAGPADSPLTVRITNPSGGWSSERIVHITGTVSDSSLTRAFFVLNGTYTTIPVSSGNFNTEQVLSTGENCVQVVASNQSGTGRDSIVVYSKVPQKDVKITLNWDTNGTDVDMWVTDPNKEKCDYQHKDTAIGGKLDVDVTTGYGPETFTLSNAIPGNYLVQAHYFSANAEKQSNCKVSIILHEGTPEETRKDYYFILTKTGDVETLESIYIK